MCSFNDREWGVQTGLLKPGSQSSAMENSLSPGLGRPDSMSVTTIWGWGGHPGAIHGACGEIKW